MLSLMDSIRISSPLSETRLMAQTMTGKVQKGAVEWRERNVGSSVITV